MVTKVSARRKARHAGAHRRDAFAGILPGKGARARLEKRPASFSIAGHPALDFLNTTASPRGVTIEWLEDGADLLSWLEASGGIDAAEARRAGLRAHDAVAEEARGLREWFRGLVARLKSKGASSVKPPDVARLNAVLARGAAYTAVDRVRGRLLLRSARHGKGPGALLAVVAESMAHLICEGDFTLIRKCANPGCTLWFYDRTKAHARRWCSMALCGNRAKAALHRRRARGSAPARARR
jgi:predicted RNA-binding Zn ribbon-like protein